MFLLVKIPCIEIFCEKKKSDWQNLNLWNNQVNQILIHSKFF